MADFFFSAVGLDRSGRNGLAEFSERTGIPVERLKYYNGDNVLPVGADLDSICLTVGLTPTALMLAMGKVDDRLANRLRVNAEAVAKLVGDDQGASRNGEGNHSLVYETALGKLYQGDCLSLLPTLPSDSVDLVFADPPFNLNKLYPSGIDDDLKTRQYVEWSEWWMSECVRVLKFGGSLFLWNLPKWNIRFAEFLAQRLTFRHWIAVDIKYSLPILGRLYPSHYSLLYFVKGPKPNTFHPDRLPMEVCPKCAADLRDYGGYKDKMNPRGVNLTDIWYDIPPVRHSKHKKREGANELSIRLMDRVIQLATDEGDLVLDPFGGAGTTYAVAEIKGRRWIGIEIGPVDDIVARLEDIGEERQRLREMRGGLNHLFTQAIRQIREQIGLWTPESVRHRHAD